MTRSYKKLILHSPSFVEVSIPSHLFPNIHITPLFHQNGRDETLVLEIYNPKRVLVHCYTLSFSQITPYKPLELSPVKVAENEKVILRVGVVGGDPQSFIILSFPPSLSA